MDQPNHLTPEQLLLIYNNTRDLVFLIDVEPDGGYRVASVNAAYLQRTQLTPERIVGLRIERVLEEEQFRYVKSRYDEAVAGRRPSRYETRTTLRQEDIYLDTTLVPVYDDYGRCRHLIGVSRDITQGKLEQKAITAEKQRAENYLEIAEALIVALDLECNIKLLNRKGYAMLGHPEGSLVGRNWLEVCIDPSKHELFREGYRRVCEIGEAQGNVNYVITASGERRLISWANALIRDENGAITGLLASGEDITDRRRAERAMIASQRVLAADEVVSAVAHDFNNSLQGILGNIELALAVASDAEQLNDHLATAAKLADDAARRLRSLRRSTERYGEEHEILDIHELIDDVVAQTRPLWKDEAQRHGRAIAVTRRFGTDVRPLSGSRSELRSVLYNVVKNAIEAIQDQGEVCLETRYHKGFDVLRVTDTGIGMDRDTCTRVFQPFFSTKGMETGRGLGMSAAHSIVRVHQGDIRVKDSAPGRGTTIELRLPVTAAAAAAAAEPASSADVPRHRVLWVDDEPAIRTLARNYLDALQYEGDIVGSGAEALELLARGDYTVVITDVGMPGMSGLELALSIRSDPERRVPVIALTGWGDSVQVGDEPPPGVLRVMAKPVRLDKLREVLTGLPGAVESS